jgi:hypothetical protein
VNAPAALPGVTDGADRTAVIEQMIRRARSAGFNAWWQRIEAVGFCANPIHLVGPDEFGREQRVFTRCNNRRAIVCPSCSDLYSRDTWQLIHAGLRGGHHNIPATVAEHPQVFVTLTAPSFGAVHTTRADGSCHPRRDRHHECPHGNHKWCNHSHNEADPLLGQPLCRDCYDYVSHVMFSWHAPELWQRFTIRLRRLLKRALQRRGEPPAHIRISFMKVVELQRRALPHFHAVIRLDAKGEPGEAPLAPDTTLSARDLVVLVRQAAMETTLVVRDDKAMGFGEQTDIKIITGANQTEPTDGHISGRQIARYLAKYVTKSVADFGIGAHRFSPAIIDQLDVTEHVHDILRTVVAISGEDGYADILSWIHTLGYRGHVVSKSRQFSTTMTALRGKRTDWWKSHQSGDLSVTIRSQAGEPIPWQFQRLGLESLGDRALVVSASTRAQERRIAARQAMREGT